MYDQISKIIKGTYNLITGFSYPMPSIENHERLSFLDEDICTTLVNTEVHMAKGTLTDLSKKMVKILEKK